MPAAAVKRVQKAIEAVKSTSEWQELSGIVKQPAVPLTTGEGKEGESPIQSFDAAQSLKGEEGRNGLVQKILDVQSRIFTEDGMLKKDATDAVARR